MIRIHGVDTSGGKSDLVITPAFGFGSYYDKFVAMRTTLDGKDFTDNAIAITAETPTKQCTITVPAACDRFDITYFAYPKNTPKASYWIDIDNVVRPFEIDNTPIDNFKDSFPYEYIHINGENFYKNNIKVIVFGDSYSGVTEFSHHFLEFHSLTTINLSVFKNVILITGSKFLGICKSLEKVIIGDLDWSGVALITGNQFVDAPNNPYCEIVASTTAIGEAFRDLFQNINKWSVVEG